MKEPLVADDSFLEQVDAIRRRAGTIDLCWLGQSGFLIHHRGRWVLVDPYLSDSLTRKYADTEKPHVRLARAVVEPHALAKAIGSAVTVTSSHAHTDHLDPETLGPLARSGFVDKIIAPAASSVLARERASANVRVEPADDGSVHQIGGGITVHALASAHDTIERDEAGRCKYLGYVFEFRPFVGPDANGVFWNGEKELVLYHSGDTVAYEGLAAKLKPFRLDVAILPINGKVGNMNGIDAARLAKEAGARLVIPCHYDMFEFNTADPCEQFVPECERIGQRYRVLKLGERLTVPLERPV